MTEGKPHFRIWINPYNLRLEICPINKEALKMWTPENWKKWMARLY